MLLHSFGTFKTYQKQIVSICLLAWRHWQLICWCF